MSLSEKVIESSGFIKSQYNKKIQLGLVIGTGLGDLSRNINVDIKLPYAQIPNFPVSSVSFHASRLLLGDMNGINIIVMDGRYHYYEGHSMPEITLPIRVLHQFGVKTILITNAASSIRKNLTPGSLAVITDHLNLMGNNPLIGPYEPFLGERFTDMSEPYNKQLIDSASKIANQNNILLKKIVFAAISGPSLLSASEIKMIRKFGADAIGMSVVPEVLVARQLGMNVIAVSAITDQSLPEKMTKIEAADVSREATGIVKDLGVLVSKLIKEI